MTLAAGKIALDADLGFQPFTLTKHLQTSIPLAVRRGTKGKISSWLRRDKVEKSGRAISTPISAAQALGLMQG